MSNDSKETNDRRGPPTFETREQARARRERAALSLEMDQHRSDTARGSDPYNTSGSFDRTKNWSRVGKR